MLALSMALHVHGTPEDNKLAHRMKQLATTLEDLTTREDTWGMPTHNLVPLETTLEDLSLTEF